MPTKKTSKPKGVKKTINEAPIFTGNLSVKFGKALDDLAECWMWQNEFIEFYGLTQWSVKKYGTGYDEYRVQCGNRVIWTGSTTTAKKLREKCE